ncbi:hypothetical protein [Gorillibacterium sp. sgz5001074]|uniref:hypothetical protein n=1 Tax=Gorillibacterium sp. sgz5001074 TaxID=3446695 RepID=UPI003F6746AF
MSIFPGNRVSHDKANQIMNELLQQINPQNVEPVENIKNWVQVNNQVYNTDAFSSQKGYYLFYKHPIHNYQDKLFLTNKSDVIAFLKDRIYPDREEGLDVIVATEDYSNIIVCNHDGQIFLVK